MNVKERVAIKSDGRSQLSPLLLLFFTLWGLIEPYILDDEEEAVIPNFPAA